VTALRQTWQVFLREIRALLTTPMFWVMSGVFFLASAFVFVSLIVGFSDPQIRETQDINADVTVAVIRDLFYILHFFLMVQVPLLTMRAFSEERRTRTLALLQTTPVGEWPIVIGKFLANAGALSVYLAVTLIFPLWTEYISNPYWPVIISCYAALFLAIAAYVAMGLFFSAMTESQVVAGVLTYVVLFLLLIFTAILEIVPSAQLSLLAQHLTIQAHIESFLKGHVALVDVAYFAVFTFVFLFFAARQIESLRWRA